MVRTGRRPGNQDTREAILSAARDAFAERGFDAASIRTIAAAAEVDPALVHHYFGTKDQLFLAAMQVPIDPNKVIPAVLAGGLDGVGDASVYGTLRRLYQAGALKSYVVPSDEGPHRKYYGLNDRGRKALDQSAKTWGSFTRALDQLLNGRSTTNAR